ncbi:MAG: ROK family protein [Clostridiales bacterium]|jgi:predicted NBD/HSP70 family sugar kinase|nr:ROK family protein [Clostridiales bacterium]
MLCKIDKKFYPVIEYYNEFSSRVKKSGLSAPFKLALERNDSQVYRFEAEVYKDGVHNIENSTFAERIIKSLLWIVGGYKLYINAPYKLFEKIAKIFSENGKRAFDVKFMEKIYEKPFSIEYREANNLPEANESGVSIGGHYNGCRIGFDAGGSDRKVCAAINGNVVYSEETVWHPKLNSDYRYHYDGIYDSIKKAASYLPRVDCIGVSSAGIYVNNRAMAASLFIKVPEDDFDKHIKDVYINIAERFGAKTEVANDGDVAALAGALELNDNRVLGIAMGTSQAGGYIDGSGNIKGWLNELAFVPADMQKDGAIDEWSGDKGCGVKYFSQDAVIKLAEFAEIRLNEKLSPHDKLKYIQDNFDKNSKIPKIFEDIGVYFGNAILYYALFYDIKYVLLLGRVSGGAGGNIIKSVAEEVLGEYGSNIKIILPDESNRRVGQAIAAASLPDIN